jgi:hypothetical protein
LEADHHHIGAQFSEAGHLHGNPVRRKVAKNVTQKVQLKLLLPRFAMTSWSQSYDFEIYNYSSSVVVSSNVFFKLVESILFSERTWLLVALKYFTVLAW